MYDFAKHRSYINVHDKKFAIIHSDTILCPARFAQRCQLSNFVGVRRCCVVAFPLSSVLGHDEQLTTIHFTQHCLLPLTRHMLIVYWRSTVVRSHTLAKCRSCHFKLLTNVCITAGLIVAASAGIDPLSVSMCQRSVPHNSTGTFPLDCPVYPLVCLCTDPSKCRQAGGLDLETEPSVVPSSGTPAPLRRRLGLP